MCIIGVLGILQSQAAVLREQVKHLSEANNSLKKISEESEVAIQKHTRDYDNTQVRYLLAGKLYMQNAYFYEDGHLLALVGTNGLNLI